MEKIRDWNLNRQNDVVDIISGKCLKFHYLKNNSLQKADLKSAKTLKPFTCSGQIW